MKKTLFFIVNIFYSDKFIQLPPFLVDDPLEADQDNGDENHPKDLYKSEIHGVKLCLSFGQNHAICSVTRNLHLQTINDDTSI